MIKPEFQFFSSWTFKSCFQTVCLCWSMNGPFKLEEHRLHNFNNLQINWLDTCALMDGFCIWIFVDFKRMDIVFWFVDYLVRIAQETQVWIAKNNNRVCGHYNLFHPNLNWFGIKLKRLSTKPFGYIQFKSQ